MLRVRVLGELALELDGAHVDPPAGRRARSLLGLLALDHRSHARSDIAARFWPDVLDESARGSLRGALMELRRALAPVGDRYLVATRERVGLGPDVWIDAEAFTNEVDAGRLVDAMALYRGDLLSGLDDDWVLVARDEWRDRAGAVLGRLADAADETGDDAAAIAYTRRIVALDPLAEAGQRALIRRLAATGDRPAALAAYGRYAERLRSELRIAPSPATRALVDALRETDDDGGGTATANDGPVLAERPVTVTASATVTLLVSDLVFAAEGLARMGDEAAERLRQVHATVVREVAGHHGAHTVQPLGDSLMVVFGSSVDALACAVSIQQALTPGVLAAEAPAPRVRVGLTAGEPLREQADYVGTAVLVARRLCQRAAGGQILVSDLVRQLLGGRDGVLLRDVGVLELDGVAQPVAACELAWAPRVGEHAPLPAELSRDQGALIGRDAELAELAELAACVREARTGGFRVAVVTGAPGIGKTRLVAELCRRAHAEGAASLLGHCHEETVAPYEPLIEALRRLDRAPRPDGPADGPGTARHALDLLVPALDDDAADASAGQRYTLFEAVGTVLESTARTGPVIVVLDDLQWADDATLLLVRHLARTIPDTPVLVVGTCRDDEIADDAPLASAFAELRRARRLTTVVLGGLAADDVAVLVRRLGVELDASTAGAVAARSEGNPFFVEEIVRNLARGGALVVPQSVKDLLRRRLRRLPDASGRAIAAAAVLGREFDLDALALVTGDDPDSLVGALEDALAERIVLPLPGVVGRFAFSHALIRETVHDELSPARRPLMHRRAAAALEQLHPTRLDELADAIAQHHLQAGDDERAFDLQLRAARAAWRVHGPETAIVHLGAALETAARLGLTPDSDERARRALLDRGWMRQVTGDLEAGVADYGRALAAARAASDRRLEVEALDGLAFAGKNDDWERSRENHDAAVALAEADGDAELLVRVLSRMALSRANNLDLAGAVAAGERATALAGVTGDERDRTTAGDALKLAALQLGDLERLDRLTTVLVEAERRHGDLWYLMWALLESSFVPLARADWDLANKRLAEALEINRRVGDAFGGPLIHDATCWLERSRGDLGRAVEAGRVAVGLTERPGASPWGAWTRATLGWALLDLRAVDEAIAVLEHAAAVAASLNDRYRARGHLAWAHALAGDHTRSREAADAAHRVLEELRVPPGGAFLFGFGATAGLARAHAATGRPERGTVLVGPALEAATRSGWHEATATLSLAAGVCAAAGDDRAAAPALLRRAVVLAGTHGLDGVEWDARRVLADHADAAEAEQQRATSAAIVQRLASTVPDPGLVAGLVRATER